VDRNGVSVQPRRFEEVLLENIYIYIYIYISKEKGSRFQDKEQQSRNSKKEEKQ
jgi:hypothetical protein